MPRKHCSRLLAGIIFLIACLLLPGAGIALADENTPAQAAAETFTIRFMNYAQTATMQQIEVAPGELPVYSGNTPSKLSVNLNNYTSKFTFAGWQPEIVPAVADAVYAPVFDVSTTFTLQTTSHGSYETLRQVLPSNYAKLDPGVRAEMILRDEQHNILTTTLVIDNATMSALTPAEQVILRTQQGDISVSNALLNYLESLGTNISIQAATVTPKNEAVYNKMTTAQQASAEAAVLCLDIAFMQGQDVLLLHENNAAATGDFSVTVPYQAEDTAAQPTVKLIAEDGTATRIPAAYSAGNLSFSAAQSGCYTITEEVVTEDAFTIALQPVDESISAGQEFSCRAVLTQTAKTQAGGNVQAFTIPVEFDANLTWTGFTAADGLNVNARCSGSTLTLSYTDAANGFSLDSGESITLGEVSFRAPQDAGLFTDGEYVIADIGIGSGSNEIAVSGRQYGVPAQAAASASMTVHRITVTFPQDLIGYTVAETAPVIYGQPFSFDIMPWDGYAAPIVSVDGQVLSASSTAGVYTYTLPNITASVTVAISPVMAEYSITYMDGDKTISDLSPAKYTFGKGAALPQATKPGYKLAGWYADAAHSGQAITDISKTDFGNKVFYAKWQPLPITLTEESFIVELIKGEAMADLDLAGFIADDGGTDGKISMEKTDNSVLPQGLMLVDGYIIGTPQQAGENTAVIRFVSPTGATAELTLIFQVQDIVPLTVSFTGSVAAPEAHTDFDLLGGYLEQNGLLYVPAGEVLHFTAAADTGYVLTVSMTYGGETRTLMPNEAGIYTVATEGGGGSLTVTLHLALDTALIDIFAPTRDDVTGGGKIFQPFSVYSGSKTLVLFAVRDDAIGGLTLSDGTAIYRTDHYNGYTHAALLDLTGLAVDDLEEYVAARLGTASAANQALEYDMDVNNSGDFSVTDISVLYDFTSRTTLQWQPDDALLLIGDHDAGMSLDAADVAALAAAYADRFIGQ